MGTFESTTVARPDSISQIIVREPELHAAYVEPNWYVAYTRANHEKRVAEQLERRAVEYLLPFYTSVRRWKDRREVVRLWAFFCFFLFCFSLSDRAPLFHV